MDYNTYRKNYWIHKEIILTCGDFSRKILLEILLWRFYWRHKDSFRNINDSFGDSKITLET
jgi:hypothetical protein